MEKEGRNQRGIGAPEADFFLQWGIRRRLRCVKVREEDESQERSIGVARRRITSRIDRRVVRAEKEAPPLLPSRLSRNIVSVMLPSIGVENRRLQSSSPEKEDWYYSTRGATRTEVSGRANLEGGGDEKGFVWPKFYISLSSKEKEEDFMAMKGCKLPQRPKKRAKCIQRSIHLVCPGTWLSELSHERYEVREKKCSEKTAETKRFEGLGEHGKRFRLRKRGYT